MPHAFPLLHSSSDENNVPWADKTSTALRHLSKILDTSVVDLKYCLLDPYPGWCRSGIAPPKTRFPAGKNPFTAAELKWFTAAGDINLQHTKRCVYTLDALLALCNPRSHCSLAVTHWPLFLSLNWYVSLFHVPDLHHYKKTGNYWAWLVIVITFTEMQPKEPTPGTPASQLSRHHPSAQPEEDVESL